MDWEIPGFGLVHGEHIVLDFNGTLAVDGAMKEETAALLRELGNSFSLHVLTADTQGTAAMALADLPVTLHIFQGEAAGWEKQRIVEELGAAACICLGNGRNDVGMFQIAGLAIAVLEAEGTFAGLLPHAHLVVRSIEEGLQLLLNSKRLIAGLRG